MVIVFKNLHRLQKMPEELQEGVFQKLFELAEIAKMDKKDQMMYEDSLKAYRDLKNAMDTYYEDGIKAGEERGIKLGEEKGAKKNTLKMAKRMKEEGFSRETIMKITGLSEDEIAKLD